MRKPYPSDLTDAQWAHNGPRDNEIAALIRKAGGKGRSLDVLHQETQRVINDWQAMRPASPQPKGRDRTLTWEAQQVIEQRTGIRRGKTQVRRFPKRLGLKPRKAAAIPVPPQSTPEEHARKQAAFLEDNLEPRLEEARRKADGAVTAKLNEAYKWLLVPYQEGTSPQDWEILALQGATLGSTGKGQTEVPALLTPITPP